MAHRWQGFTTAVLVGSFVVALGAVGDRAGAQTEPDSENPDTEEVETPEPTTGSDEARFTCQLQNGEYTVMYAPTSQPGAMYAWATPADMGSAWPADRRCAEISRRLEEYRPDGLLELQTGQENGYNTVCVTTESVPSCRIVFTVPPGQDPVITRDMVFDNLVLADQGQTTDGVNTFVEGDNILDGLGDVLGLPSGRSGSSGNIELQPFLDAADGGTGTRLNNNSGRPLNPDNF
ncbi:MAG: COP23 domain-containing protein [Cyanobacteria bacterium P01_E01_bin.43]